MFQNKSDAKRNAKSQLRPGMDKATVVQRDDGLYDVITSDDDAEPCLEQEVGDWTWENGEKVWHENESFDPDRVTA